MLGASGPREQPWWDFRKQPSAHLKPKLISKSNINRISPTCEISKIPQNMYWSPRVCRLPMVARPGSGPSSALVPNGDGYSLTGRLCIGLLPFLHRYEHWFFREEMGTTFEICLFYIAKGKRGISDLLVKSWQSAKIYSEVRKYTRRLYCFDP